MVKIEKFIKRLVDRIGKMVMVDVTQDQDVTLGPDPLEVEQGYANTSDNGLEEIVEQERAMTRRQFITTIGLSLTGLVLGRRTAEASCGTRPRKLKGDWPSVQKQMHRAVQHHDDLSMLYERHLREGNYFRREKRLVVADRDVEHYYIEQVPFGYALTRPYVLLFLKRLAEQHHRRFGRKLKVTSLTRSVEYQNKLRKGNSNATRPERSPHVRGAGIDFSYKPMSCAEMNWMREQLVTLENRGVIEATEERSQRTFHVMVFKKYADYVRDRLGLDEGAFDEYYKEQTGGELY